MSRTCFSTRARLFKASARFADETFLRAEAPLLFAFGLLARVAGLADLADWPWLRDLAAFAALVSLAFVGSAAFATRFLALLAALWTWWALWTCWALATLRAGRALLAGLRLAALLLAFAAFAGRALLLATLRVGIGAAAFKRFSSTGVDSSSPATRARAAPSDRAGADNRGDGNAAPAADLLAFVFMAINVWGWQPLRSYLELRRV